MRTHGHRAAHIDPLDLIQREEVAALSPERYGLTNPEQRFNVNGILWTKRVGEAVEGSGEEWWTLSEIRDHLRRVYVGNIAYEVCAIFFFTFQFRFKMILSTSIIVYALSFQVRAPLVLTFTRVAEFTLAYGYAPLSGRRGQEKAHT